MENNIEGLIKLGLKVGNNFNMREDCIIDPSHCFLITIGDSVTLAPRVHILAHDASTKMFLGYTRVGLVNIGNNVFIGASCTILPNVKIGNNCIIGANATVTKDIPDNSVAVGNPARVICSTDEYINKNKMKMNERPVYDASYIITNITDEKKQQMINDLKSGIGYIK